MLVSAVAGPEVQTDQALGRRPRAPGCRWLFAPSTCSTGDRASFSRTVKAIQSSTVAEVIPIQVPIGEEVLRSRGWSTWSAARPTTLAARREWQGDRGGRPRRAGRRTWPRRARPLIEMVAEQDEKLMETYLEKGALDPETFRKGAQGRPSRRAPLCPVFALAGGQEHRRPAADGPPLVDLSPSPSWRPFTANVGRARSKQLSASADCRRSSPNVFKTHLRPLHRPDHAACGWLSGGGRPPTPPSNNANRGRNRAPRPRCR